MGVTHTFVNPKADGGDATITRPSDWNATHSISDIAQVLNAQTALSLSNPFVNGVGAADGFMQAAWQNKSTGTNASTDIVLTADNGTDSTWYMDMGINGSNYSVGTWTISGPGDAYVVNANGHMTIGTLTTGKGVDIHTGGSLEANLRMSFDDDRITAAVPMIGGSGPAIAMYSGMFNQ